ncbi:unnamed protein product [Allacma fusca]|uniref:Trafficking protein particle complex subunit 12 n=1 Tax=Allacma fusca TaxID=39272 RepID=A0A8J2LAV9_9HEXA|nr:unnamed protein product [Allacma fusca]
MDSGSSNDDDEPKICTVFSSDSKSSKTIFDTIAFTSPKKEEKPFVAVETSVASAASVFDTPKSSQASISQSLEAERGQKEVSLVQTDFGSGDDFSTKLDGGGIDINKDVPLSQPSSLGPELVVEDLSKLKLDRVDNQEELVGAEDSPLPSANVLFADAPEVPFPVGLGSFDMTSDKSSFVSGGMSVMTTPQVPVIPAKSGADTFATVYSSSNASYDSWIPSENTKKILLAITSGTEASNYIPDASTMTMPGIIHEVEMSDKVAINMARIFGEAEASRRKILTVDNVTQDDNGLRELIKLGCYRSAINLTKRLLVLYDQGPGQIDKYSKHTPHSLQLWYTRIALLVRIREFSHADDEIKAFKDFENPDMYFEYYPELYNHGNKGSLVPFHFRLLAAEIPQYMRKISDTLDKLTHILSIVQQIISNVTQGICEDGSPVQLEDERKEKSLQIWSKREVRVLYSLANAAIFCKDFNGALLYLTLLLQKDTEHEMQLKSSIGRLFLQFGDIASAERYLNLAAELSRANSETDRVDTLVDSGLLAISQNNYSDAFNSFKQALAIQPDNYMLTNNMAVCLVYLGKVKDALALMESTVKQNTPQLLQENVILNLSTIYELENSDGSKKNSLLKLISEYKGDGINLASLKMPNLV